MLKLYTYFRSSCAYRIRIALNLKGLEYESIPINLRTGMQRSVEYRAVNPQGLVPSLMIENQTLTQSIAIMEFLEETHPNPKLLPMDPFQRAHVRAVAQAVACEMHPLNNLQVLNYLRSNLSVTEQQKREWYFHWLSDGFSAIEKLIVSSHKQYCFGDSITFADICLIPQIFNALRFEYDMKQHKGLMSIYENCLKVSAFDKARPEHQLDCAD